MTKSLKLSFHLLIWTIFYLVMLTVVDSLLEIVGMGNLLNMRLISEIALILLLSLILPFYIFYFLWQGWLNKKSRLFFIVAGVLTIILLPFLYLLLDDEPLTVTLYFKMLILVIFFSMLGYLVRGFLHGLKLKGEKEALQKQLLQTELAFLKGQISPHFLFNTLNNIDALIKINPDEASRSLISMSEIMRYMIYDTKENTVPLKQELNYLESLVALYNLRFKKEGLIKFDVEGDPSNYEVPPMLLIPIAENAFKHHNNKHNQSGVMMKVDINGKEMVLTCNNAYDPDAKKTVSSGLGLQTLKRRLDLLFPGKYTMEVSPSTSTFNIRLVIPLLPNQMVNSPINI
ncbi:sensor histidine kinase [Flavitalea sp.]|nr:histidine kinase [Flavitalea sp.]